MSAAVGTHSLSMLSPPLDTSQAQQQQQQQPHGTASPSSTDAESSLRSADVEADLVAIIQMQHARVEQQRRALQVRPHAATQRYVSPVFADTALTPYRREAAAPAHPPDLRLVSIGSSAVPSQEPIRTTQALPRHASSHAHRAIHVTENGDRREATDACIAEPAEDGSRDDEEDEVSSDIDRHEERQLQRAQRALQAEMYTQMENNGRPSSPLFSWQNGTDVAAGARAGAADSRAQPVPLHARQSEKEDRDRDPRDGLDASAHAPSDGGKDTLPRHVDAAAVHRASSAQPFPAASISDDKAPFDPADALHSRAEIIHGGGADGSAGLTIDPREDAGAAQDSYRAFLAEVRRQHHKVLRRQQADHVAHTQPPPVRASGSPTLTRQAADNTTATHIADTQDDHRVRPHNSEIVAMAVPAWHNRYRSPPLAALYHAHKYGLLQQSRSNLTYEQHLGQMGLKTPSSVGAAASSDQGQSPFLPHEYRYSAQKPARPPPAGVDVPASSQATADGTTRASAAAATGRAVPASFSAAPAGTRRADRKGAADGAWAPPPPPPLLAATADVRTVSPTQHTRPLRSEQQQSEPTQSGAQPATTHAGAAVESASPVEPFADVLLHDSLQASRGTSPQRPRLPRSAGNAAGHSPFQLNAPLYATTTAIRQDHDGARAVGTGSSPAVSPSSMIPELATLTPRSVRSASVNAAKGLHPRPAAHRVRDPVGPSQPLPRHVPAMHTVDDVHARDWRGGAPEAARANPAAELPAGVDEEPTNAPILAGGTPGTVRLMPAVEAAAPTHTAAADLLDNAELDQLWKQPAVEPFDVARPHATRARRRQAHRLLCSGKGGSSVAALRKAVEEFWKPKRARVGTARAALAAAVSTSREGVVPYPFTSEGAVAHETVVNHAGASLPSSAAGSGEHPRVPYFESSRIGVVLHDIKQEAAREANRRLVRVESMPGGAQATGVPAEAAAVPSSTVKEQKNVFYYYGKGFRAL